MEDQDPLANNVVVLLIAMGSAALVVSMYHLIAICFCHQRFTTDQTTPQERHPPQHLEGASSAVSISESTSSVAQLIPSHKYHKRRKGDDEGGTCAVCLGDFEEGEELRTLPECMHSFHVPCIDMWLHSHSSCPICRASATPSPAVHHRGPAPDYSSGDLNAHHSIDMMQIALVPNALLQR